MSKEYNASNIQVLKGLEPVQKRPGMYTNTHNPNHIIEEVIDNACDEALGGNANKISIILEKNGFITVEDNGRGIPVDYHDEGKSAAEVIFTSLHSGGKFDKSEDSSYMFAGGLHGVGVSVTNALSERLEVIIKRDGFVHALAFSNGDLVEPLHQLKKIAKKETGTAIKVLPNPKYFDEPTISIKDIESILRSKSVLLSGVEIILNIEKNDGTWEEKSWYYENGIEEYFDEIIHERETVLPVFKGERYLEEDNESFNKGEGAQWCLTWLYEGSHRESYVNLIPTLLGGTHETGFKNGLFDAIKSYIEQNEMMPRGIKIHSDDVWQNVCLILSTKIADPQFHGQTKEKLNNRTAVKLLHNTIKDDFEHWLNENPEHAKNLAENIIKNAQQRNKKNKKKEIRREHGITFLPGKLSDCQSKNPEEREVFLVEGDSAGGSAKQGRDKVTQAIMALRGKPVNTWEMSSDDILSNAEIADVSAAIGVKEHSKDDEIDLKKLRYHKICILSDADKDGHHIQVLLLALFMQHFPKLIEYGYIYIAQPPLYRIDVRHKNKKKNKEETFYILDDSEYDEVLKRLEKEGVSEDNIKIGRFKGLGEMSPNQLWETTLDPDTRHLMQIKVSDEDWLDTKNMLDMLLAKKRSPDRKEWITNKGDFKEYEVGL